MTRLRRPRRPRTIPRGTALGDGAGGHVAGTDLSRTGARPKTRGEDMPVCERLAKKADHESEHGLQTNARKRLQRPHITRLTLAPSVYLKLWVHVGILICIFCPTFEYFVPSSTMHASLE